MAFLQNLRLACRNALRRPGFTALVVLTLALGIGVNSAVFALLDAVLLRSLPYRDPSRLVFVWQTLPEHNVAELEGTPFDYAAWKRVPSFASVALIATDAYTLGAGDSSAAAAADEPERVRGARVTASLMPLLGIAPRVGRAFTAEEDDAGAAPVAVLSDGLWRRRYGADPGIVGRAIRVNGVLHTIVGVMPPAASLPGPIAGSSELWLPARMTPSERDNQTSHNYSIVARLADRVAPAAASAEIDAFAKQMAREYPDSHRGLGARLVPFTEQTIRGIRPTLLVLAGGVALLLIVACANASTLLIARAANRRHEIAVRSALGATRWQLLMLAVADSVVFAVLGGLAGLLLGGWVLHVFLPLLADNLPAFAVVDIDGRVAAFTAALTALLAVAFGTIVAVHESQGIVDGLRLSSRTTTAGGSVVRTRNALVVAQVSLAVLLLCAAGLMLQSVGRLARVSPGFDPMHVLTFKLSLAGESYSEAPRRASFVRQLVERLGSAPGVERAGLTSVIPFGGTRGANGVEIEGRPKKPGESIIVDQRHVTPDYFQVMRIPLLRGRAMAATDDAQAEKVVIINRSMAERYWPDGDPLDRRVRVTAGFNSGVWLRIVGVVENVRHISLARETVPEMYLPYAQASVQTFTVVVRTHGDPSSVLPAARDSVRSVDGALPLYDVRLMEDRIAGSFAQTRATMLLLLVTAALAAALAGVAIYGSIWYAVSQRVPEIGVRLALGATRASVFGSVVRGALGLTSVGAGLGIAASLAAGPLLRGFLFETPAVNPQAYGTVVAVLLGLTVAASIAPAWKAMSVDPIAALRNE